MSGRAMEILRHRWTVPVLLLAIGVIIPLVATSGFHLRLAMLVWIYAILGMGFNMLFGYMGQLSLGQQAFFALGAYSTILLESKLGLPLSLSIIGGLALTAMGGFAIGVPVLRLRGHYLAMATLAFALLLEGLLLRWFDLTGGSAGIAVPALEMFGGALDRYDLYYLVFGAVILAFLFYDLLISTHVGRAIEAIRDDETAAEAMGINARRTKMKIFVLAAVLAGVAGTLYALMARHVDPTYSALHVNISLLTLAVIGGLGTRLGPLLGAFVVVLAPQFLAGLRELELLLYGIGLLAVLLFLPRGLAGLLEGRGGVRLPWQAGRTQRQKSTHGATSPAPQSAGE